MAYNYTIQIFNHNIKCLLIIMLTLCLLAVLRMAGALQKSTEVMKAMQNLVKIPEIQATMRELSKEMMKVWNSVNKNIKAS